MTCKKRKQVEVLETLDSPQPTMHSASSLETNTNTSQKTMYLQKTETRNFPQERVDHEV